VAAVSVTRRPAVELSSLPVDSDPAFEDVVDSVGVVVAGAVVLVVWSVVEVDKIEEVV